MVHFHASRQNTHIHLKNNNNNKKGTKTSSQNINALLDNTNDAIHELCHERIVLSNNEGHISCCIFLFLVRPLIATTKYL